MSVARPIRWGAPVVAFGLGLWLFSSSDRDGRAVREARPPATEPADDGDAPGRLAAPAAREEDGPPREALELDSAEEPLARSTGEERARIEQLLSDFRARRALRGPGPVSGVLRSESGTWTDVERLVDGRVQVELVSRDGKERSFDAHLDRRTEPSGEEVITFLFHEVPRTEYELRITSLEHHRWSPDTMLVQAPAAGLEIWCQDRRDTIELGFRVVDADTREAVEPYSAYAIRMERSAEDGVSFHAGELSLAGFPPDAALTWSIGAAGYAPAFGDERDFVEQPDGRWVADVELRRGWGTRFLALGRNPTSGPLQGVRVLLDGEEAGRTDAEGLLEVRRPAAPSTLAARWSDWELLDDTVPPAPVLDHRGQYTVLWMAKPR